MASERVRVDSLGRTWFRLDAFLLIAVIVTTTVGCGGGPSISVSSADGQATLTVDPGALPKGTSPADLSLRALPLDQIPANSGFAAVAAYELQPHGLQLLTPAALNIQLQFDRLPALLVAFHVAGERQDLVVLEEGAWDPDLGRVTLSARLSHFSSWLVLAPVDENPGGRQIELSPLSLSVAAPSNVAVGDSFQVTATVRLIVVPGQLAERLVYRHYIYKTFVGLTFGEPTIHQAIVSEGPWSLRGRFWASSWPYGDPSPVSPERVNSAPPWSSVSARTFTARQTFRCEFPGTAKIRYFTDGRVPFELQPPSDGTNNGSLVTYLEEERVFVECVGSSGTATASPRLQANRPPVVTRIQATLAAPTTRYQVTANDPDGDQLTYEWKMAGEGCGTPSVPWSLSRETVEWSHSDRPPDNCKHTGTDHDVTVSVTVSDRKGGTATCVIFGTATLDIDNPPCQ